MFFDSLSRVTRRVSLPSFSLPHPIPEFHIDSLKVKPQRRYSFGKPKEEKEVAVPLAAGMDVSVTYYPWNDGRNRHVGGAAKRDMLAKLNAWRKDRFKTKEGGETRSQRKSGKMSEKDYLVLLGLSADALIGISPEEKKTMVKEAIKSISVRNHPDKFLEDPSYEAKVELMKKVNSARDFFDI